MSGARHDATPCDPIGEYLDQLRAGLRVAPIQAELIVAEAEDHLRETAAAGIAVGMTELEAQQAAISSFGPVRAVVRAHAARRGQVLADVPMAAWKLASLLLITAGSAGLAAVSLLPARPAPSPIALFRWHLLHERWRVLRVWSGPKLTLVPVPWPGPDRPWLAWSAAVAAGSVLLAGYCLARRRQRRRGRLRGPLLAGFFPVVAASFFGVLALALFALHLSGAGGTFDPALVVVACLALAVGYAVRVTRKLLRQPRGQMGALGRVLGQG